MKITEIINVLRNYPSNSINYDSKLQAFISNKETTTDDLLNLLVFLEKEPFKELLSIDIVYQIYNRIHKTSCDKTKEQVLKLFDNFDYQTISYFLELTRYVQNAPIPDEIFHKFMTLFQNDFVYLRRIKCSITESWDSSLTILDFLSNDNDDYVRQHVASNNRIDFKIQQKLSSDKSAEVRLSLAQNKNLDISILEKLINDENMLVTSFARHNKGISVEQRIHIYNKILNGLLGHPYKRHLLKFWIRDEIKLTIEKSNEYSDTINPQLSDKFNDEELSKLLLVALEQYLNKKESIADDFLKYVIYAIFLEYGDEFSLSKTREQVHPIQMNI